MYLYGPVPVATGPARFSSDAKGVSLMSLMHYARTREGRKPMKVIGCGFGFVLALVLPVAAHGQIEVTGKHNRIFRIVQIIDDSNMLAELREVDGNRNLASKTF